MYKQIYFIVIFCIFAVITAQTDEYTDLFDTPANENTQSELSPPMSKHEFKIFGESAFNFYIPTVPENINFEGSIRRIGYDNDLGISWNYYYDNINLVSVVTNWNIALTLSNEDFGPQNIAVTPLENYIGFNLWKFNIKAGYQFYEWGTADRLNPSDTLNPRDFTMGPEADKLSLLSLYTSFQPLDIIKLEAVYVPFVQNDLFPVNFADKIPQSLFYGMTDDGGIPPMPFIQTHPSNVIVNKFEFDLTKPVAAGRIIFRVPNVDFSFSYIYEFDRYYTPDISLTKDNFNTPFGPAAYYRISKIELNRNRIHRVSADVKGVINDFSLWAEFSYAISTDYSMNSYKIRNHTFSYITGFDWRFGPDNEFYLNLQYMGEFNPFYDSEFYNDYTDGLPDTTETADRTYMEKYYYRAITDRLALTDAGLIQGLSLFVELPFTAGSIRITPSLTAAYTVPLLYNYQHEERYGSLYVNTEISIEPIDSLSIVVGGNLFFSWIKYKEADQYYKWIENDGSDSDDYLNTVIFNKSDRTGLFYNDTGVYIAISYKWDMILIKNY